MLRALPADALLRRRARVLLLLGPSPLRPREAYSIGFALPGDGDAAGDGDGGDGGGGGSSSAGRQQQQQHAAAAAAAAPPPPPPDAALLKEVATAGKRLLRSLIVQGGEIEEWADVCAPTKLFLLVQAPAGAPPGPGFAPRRGFAPALRGRAFQVNVDARVEPPPGGRWPWAGAAADASAACDQHQHQQQQQRARAAHGEQPLEEHLEASMQLCDSDGDGGGGGGSEGGDDGGVGGGGAGAAAAGGVISDPDELIWFQCTHAVKGMKPLDSQPE